MSAESALVRLMQSSDSRAIALVGGWGRGKTHLWRHLVATTPKQARDKSSYVSLFGVNNLEDLKLAIFQKEIDAGPQVEEPTSWEKLKKKFSWRTTTETLSQLENPWIGNIKSLYRTVAFSAVRNRLICFDDFERKGAELALEEVLGLITFLCEERECAVVLILNDSTLESIADWNKYREKVFNAEVSYKPSAKACMDIIFGDDDTAEWYRGAREVLGQLDVSNMRIMHRIKDGLEPFAARYENASSETKFQIGATLALYSYCHNASGEGAPPVERALKNPLHRLSVAANNKDERSEDEKRWDMILSKVDFYPDELDLAVVSYLQDGYPNIDAFDEQVARMEAAQLVDSAERAFSSAWSNYNDSFADNQQDIIASFRAAFPAAAPKMHAMNADSSISLMRRLGQNELADSFIEQWIAPRRGDRRRELSVREAQTFGPLADSKFIEALKEAEKNETTEPDLTDAMATVARGQGSVDQALQTISLADASAIAQWLRANAGRPSRTFITTSMQFMGAEHVGKAQNLIKESLNLLSKESPINAVRVERILSSLDQ